jgi:hypothetical protein
MHNPYHKILAKLKPPPSIPSLKMGILEKKKNTQEIISNLKPHQNCGILFICHKNICCPKKFASLVLSFNYAFALGNGLFRREIMEGKKMLTIKSSA